MLNLLNIFKQLQVQMVATKDNPFLHGIQNNFGGTKSVGHLYFFIGICALILLLVLCSNISFASGILRIHILTVQYGY